MYSLRQVVDNHYNAVVAISRDRQVGYEVNAKSLPMAFGYWLWEAHGFPTLVVSSMARVPACNVSLRIASHLHQEIPVFHT